MSIEYIATLSKDLNAKAITKLNELLGERYLVIESSEKVLRLAFGKELTRSEWPDDARVYWGANSICIAFDSAHRDLQVEVIRLLRLDLSSLGYDCEFEER